MVEASGEVEPAKVELRPPVKPAAVKCTGEFSIHLFFFSRSFGCSHDLPPQIHASTATAKGSRRVPSRVSTRCATYAFPFRTVRAPGSAEYATKSFRPSQRQSLTETSTATKKLRRCALAATVSFLIWCAPLPSFLLTLLFPVVVVACVNCCGDDKFTLCKKCEEEDWIKCHRCHPVGTDYICEECEKKE